MWDRTRTWWAKRSRKAVVPTPAAELTPHAVLFSVPTAFRYEKVEVGTYRGLLYMEALGSGSKQEGRLLTIWRDNTAYQAAQPRFLHDTGLTSNDAVWEGFHLDTCLAKRRWWRRLTLTQVWAGLATLFLLLGYAQQARDACGWLVGPPAIEPSIESAPINILAGEPFKFTVAVRNTRALGDCFIEFLDQSVDSSDALALDPLSLRSFPAVKPNGEAVLPVSGKAKQEGEFNVIVKGRATAGLIWSERTFESPRKVKVWRPVAIGPRRVKHTTKDGKSCEAEFKLLVGRHFPVGLEAEAKLERVPNVCFVGVRFPDMHSASPPHETMRPGHEVATLEWRTRELAPMCVAPFTLLLKNVGSQNKTREQWEAIVESIQCTFSEAHPGNLVFREPMDTDLPSVSDSAVNTAGPATISGPIGRKTVPRNCRTQ